jgi:hypothetical protein
MASAFANKPNLRTSSRLPSLSQEASVTLAEVACLLACGAVAILAVGLLRLPIRIPGHAVLRGVLPMAMGLALVPRRSAGSIMAVGAAITALGMSWGGIGRFPAAAVLSVVALGPVFDLVSSSTAQGWRLYARFAVAGAVANLAGFAMRWAMATFGWELADSRQFASFWSPALVSFIVCGAMAGLVSAGFWFRLRGGDDLRRP